MVGAVSAANKNKAKNLKMKKIILAAAAITMATFANAAVIDWKYTGVADDKGYTLYVFSSAVADKYDTFADFATGKIATGTVAETKAGPRTVYQIAASTLSGVTKDSTLYFALIKDSSAKTYTYGSISTSGFVYDSQAQETSPGTLEIKASDLANNGTIGTTPGPDPIPEPTSAMLLVLGVAGLALKRKQK